MRIPPNQLYSHPPPTNPPIYTKNLQNPKSLTFSPKDSSNLIQLIHNSHRLVSARSVLFLIHGAVQNNANTPSSSPAVQGSPFKSGFQQITYQKQTIKEKKEKQVLSKFNPPTTFMPLRRCLQPLVHRISPLQPLSGNSRLFKRPHKTPFFLSFRPTRQSASLCRAQEKCRGRCCLYSASAAPFLHLQP